jgi:hypothetical protein
MPSGNSHGGRRSGAGRPRGALGRRGGVLQMSLASLAREYAEEAITTLATIMKDEAAPASARIRAAIEILDRGYGRPPQSREVLTPSSQSERSEKKYSAASTSSTKRATHHARYVRLVAPVQPS